MKREWKPGDVASSEFGLAFVVDFNKAGCNEAHDYYGRHVHLSNGDWSSVNDPSLRRLVVIDPEDREQVERLIDAYVAVMTADDRDGNKRGAVPKMQAALREFADPTPQIEEPADPKTPVADRRDNIWRRLADGEWVCTSGPDIGEYLDWSRLASERGPLEVQA